MAKQEDDFTETLRLQLTEMDMLQSMFPNHGEFQVDDPSVVADVNDYVDKKTIRLPARIDFVIHLQIDEKFKFELACSFPHDYPLTEPEIFVRSPQLDRNQQHQINEDLLLRVSQMERGEVCVYSIIQWLQDNGSNYATTTKTTTNETTQQCTADNEDKEPQFSRYWIYSHHIYNKMKRRNILDLAKELGLTGFCLPGKPGIICAEGMDANCREFWDRVKNMHWKKIMCKMKEREDMDKDCVANLRRFRTFEEVAFEVRRGPGREYHMDMGEFFQYLEQHQSGYVFKSYFGVDGKTNHD